MNVRKREKNPTMEAMIGDAAGQIWKLLYENGEISTAQMVRESGLPRDLAQRAVGWLAREEKIELEKVKRFEKIRLR